MSTLQSIWFGLIGIQLIGYTVLAGFDLGIGTWHLLSRKDDERRTMLGVIGPFWDGNQVWLVAAGAALFAAFPAVYATVFSGFYLALMLLLFALIWRSVAIEAGARGGTPRIRAFWDASFALTSVVSIVLLGVALGNILRGLPLTPDGEYSGSFFTLLNPFALLVGVLNLALLSMHGALYLGMKTTEPLATRARAWARRGWLLAFPLTLGTLIAAAVSQPHLLANYRAMPALWALPVLTVGALGLAPFWNARGNAGFAFAASSASIIALLCTAFTALFPVMIPALHQPAHNLTALNASSSHLTLQVMLIIAAIGLPVAYGYTVWSHRVFRGKQREEAHY